MIDKHDPPSVGETSEDTVTFDPALPGLRRSNGTPASSTLYYGPADTVDGVSSQTPSEGLGNGLKLSKEVIPCLNVQTGP